MKKILTSSLLAIVLASCSTLFLQSCSSISLNDHSIDSNNAIARVYIGLNSSKVQREIKIEEAEKIISKHFNAATIQESTGFYKGVREMSLVITIINCCHWEEPKEKFREKINKLVLQLRDDLGQESILVEYISHGKSEAFEVF